MPAVCPVGDVEVSITLNSVINYDIDRTKIYLAVDMAERAISFNVFYELVYIVYVIESAAYGVIYTSCLCQKPERASYERVRAFGTNNERV